MLFQEIKMKQRVNERIIKPNHDKKSTLNNLLIIIHIIDVRQPSPTETIVPSVSNVISKIELNGRKG